MCAWAVFVIVLEVRDFLFFLGLGSCPSLRLYLSVLEIRARNLGCQMTDADADLLAYRLPPLASVIWRSVKARRTQWQLPAGTQLCCMADSRWIATAIRHATCVTDTSPLAPDPAGGLIGWRMTGGAFGPPYYGFFLVFSRNCRRAAAGGGVPGAAERRQPRSAAALGGAQRHRRRESPAASQKTHFGECPVAEFSQKGCFLVVFQPLNLPFSRFSNPGAGQQ